jgi:hypothetical protein
MQVPWVMQQYTTTCTMSHMHMDAYAYAYAWVLAFAGVCSNLVVSTSMWIQKNQTGYCTYEYRMSHARGSGVSVINLR